MKHRGEVTSVAFSEDGRCVATASRDQTARIWNATTGQALTEALRHDASVIYARFSPDAKRLITISGDGASCVWDLPPASVTNPLLLAELAELIAGYRLNAGEFRKLWRKTPSNNFAPKLQRAHPTILARGWQRTI